MEILGHRGHPTAATPENTLAAVEAALTAGADGVEVDVRLTADGVAVCCHDATLLRTAGVARGIRSLTLAELRAIRVSGHPVPTVAEVLQVVAGRGRLVLDLKPEHRPRALVDAVATALDAASCRLPSLVLSSFDAAVLAACAAVVPQCDRAGIVTGTEPVGPALARAACRRDAALHVPVRTVLGAPDLVASVHRLGLLLRVWTVNRVVDARLLQLLGADAVISDVPDELRPCVRLGPAAASVD